MKKRRWFTCMIVMVLMLCTLSNTGGLQVRAEGDNPIQPYHSTMLNVDYESLVSKGDIIYNSIPKESFYGIPLGNGRMGSSVWMDGNGLMMQLNRNDVFSINNASSSATGLNLTNELLEGTDYASGCAYVDINFDGQVFYDDTYQRLSMYNAMETIKAKDMSFEAFAWSDRDVMVVKVTDNRQNPSPINIDLKMFRSPIETKNLHTAKSELYQKNGRIYLTQTFTEACDTGLTENDHYSKSVAAADVIGRSGVSSSQVGEGTVRLTVPGQGGSFVILLGTAASMDANENVLDMVDGELDAAVNVGYDGMVSSHTQWWHDYWSKSFIHFPALDNEDDYAVNYEMHFYNLYYIMGSTMRGKYPAKFNGLLFSTDKGYADCGSYFFWFNDARPFYGALTGNHGELLDPLFSLMTSNYDKFQKAAQQTWGAESGIWIPETFTYDGPEVLPDDIAESLRQALKAGESYPLDVLNLRLRRNYKPSRWSIRTESGLKSGYHSHLLYDAGDVANIYWDKYMYTLDDTWLRDAAYPMLKGATEFYRTSDNLEQDPDGTYHINRGGFAEAIWGAKDIICDLNMIRGVVPTTKLASEILGEDANLRPLWDDLVMNLVANPLSTDADVVMPLDTSKIHYGLARQPVTYIKHNPATPWDERQRQLINYDQINIETKARNMNMEAWQYNMNTLEAQAAYKLMMSGSSISPESPRAKSWSRFITDIARMGRSDLMSKALDSYMSFWKSHKGLTSPNRIPATNHGDQSLSIQEDGVFVEGMQNALLQSLSPGAGTTESVIHVFGAWPKDKDVSFQLAAEKGFMVTSSIQKTQVEFVELYSKLGETCLIRNNWPGEEVDVYRNGVKAETLSGDLLTFETATGEKIVLVKSGNNLEQYRRNVKVEDALTKGENSYLSNAIWEKAMNGYGPVERDLANGDTEQYDAVGLKINGKKYAKGLGVHAYSEVVYAIQGNYQTFVSDIGCEDRSGNQDASMVFQVWVDGVKRYDSGMVYSYTPTKHVEVDVAGGQTLKLVVTDGGNGKTSDRGIWGNAQVMNNTPIAVTPPTIINNTDTNIRYIGNFNHSTGRGVGDYQDDVHETTTYGDAIEYTFYGTGIEYLGAKSQNNDYQRVSIDGQHMDTFNTKSYNYASDMSLYKKLDLPLGYHTIRIEHLGIEKDQQFYMILDGFKVYNNVDTPQVYLSDIGWTSVQNGYGPVELDMSNGLDHAGDGTTMKLDGVVYGKGLGVHAPSEIVYNVGKLYHRFKSDIGIDDEMSGHTASSVVFQVWGDNTKLYDSGIMYHNTPTQHVDVDITGIDEVKLVVTDAGNGKTADHGDWANARFE